MINKFKVITANTAADIIINNKEVAFDIIKRAYIKHNNGETENPNSFFLKFKDSDKTRIIGLPAALQYGEKICGIKWIGSNPKNTEKGVDRASAVIILNDYETKYPIACIEGSFISKIRTAFSAVLAAENLGARKSAGSRLGIIGCGPVSESVLESFILRDWNISEVNVFDTDIKRASSFIEKNSNGVPANISSNINNLITSSDIILFATSAITPYLDDISLFKHKPLILHLSLRDLGIGIISQSENYTDDIDHVLNANTSLDLFYKATKSKQFINGTLADVIEGKVPISNNKIRVFSPMGLGVLDLALAEFVYREAVQTNKFIEIENFFSN